MNKTEKMSPVDDSVQRMRSELHGLLSLSPGAREVLPHLAGVERALKALGAAAFDSLPSFVLKRGAMQLESVLPEPVGPGIADLRARLAKALAAHEQASASAAAAPASAAAPPTYISNDKLQVSEATITEFMRVVEASQRSF